MSDKKVSSFNTSDLSFDENGKVVINNAEFAKLIKEQMESATEESVEMKFMDNNVTVNGNCSCR